MSEKIYAGKGKESKYGVKIDICLDDMMIYADKEIEQAKNGKKYIKLEVTKMRNEDEWGNTHTVTIDTWKPTKSNPVATDEPKW